MLTQAKIAVSLALAIATASAALAAPPRHAPRHQAAAMAHPAGVRQVPATAFLSFGSASSSARVATPTYMKIQDIGFRENLGD